MPLILTLKSYTICHRPNNQQKQNFESRPKAFLFAMILLNRKRVNR